jgi:hypothetical protein
MGGLWVIHTHTHTHIYIYIERDRQRERQREITTIDLLALNSSDKLLFILKNIFLFYKTRFLNKEVNCTEPFPSVKSSLAQEDQTL